MGESMSEWMLCFVKDISVCPEAVLALSRLIARMNDSRLSLLLKERLNNKQTLPLDEHVYQEAMKIIGGDTEHHSGAHEGGGEGVEEGLGAAQAQQEHEGEPMPIESDSVQEEQADLQKALLLSKADSPALSGDDVVIFRLTRYSQDIEAKLCSSTKIIQRVSDAGCQVRPCFSEGIFLVPITLEQYKELCLDLQKHHVWALRSDRDDIAEALRPVPKTKRPRLHHENHAMVAALTMDEDCKSNAQAQLQPPYMHSPTQEPYPFTEERVLDHVAHLHPL